MAGLAAFGVIVEPQCELETGLLEAMLAVAGSQAAEILSAPLLK